MTFDVYQKYGVTLSRLQHSEIEMLRQWRNDHKISQYMGTQQYITKEAQEKWFAEVNDREDAFYFIAYKDETPFGYACVKNIDFKIKCGEPGVFVYSDLYINSPMAYCLVEALYDFCFFKLNLEYLVVHILSTNKRAQRFNKSLGCILQPGQELIENQLYHLQKDIYIESRDKLNEFINKLYK